MTKFLSRPDFCFGGANLALEAISDQLLLALGKWLVARGVAGDGCIGVYCQV